MVFKKQDADLLRAHLKALIEVELFTIPFYLTAANSMKTSVAENSPARNLQTLAVSVAVQEMYHMQQACNLANAFDVTPEVTRLTLKAGEKILVPHLDPGGKAFYAQLGNLPDAIKAMVEVETPDESGKPVVPNPQVTYGSIADLYSATLQLLADYWAAYQQVPAKLDPHFLPDHKQVGFGAFPTRFQFNQIKQRSDALNSINAITDQGEGGTVAPANTPYTYGVDGNVLPQYQGNKSDRFYTQDLITHYRRFLDIQKGLAAAADAWYTADGQVSPDLPDWAKSISVDTLQDAINTIWSYLLDLLQSGFASGNLPENNVSQPKLPGFSSAMVSFKYLLPMMWQNGRCPSFIYRGNVTAQEVQDAMDAVDPWCLFHWDATTAALRANPKNQLNACQGLNSCEGLGWGALGTKTGDGACATADTHTCVGSNSCTAQGGCGFLSTDTQGNYLDVSEQWIPAQNSGKSTGGCQTPIATRQVFHDYAKDLPSQFASLADLENTSVWDRARALMAQHHGKLPDPISKKVGKINYDGTQRRTYVTPSSTTDVKK